MTERAATVFESWPKLLAISAATSGIHLLAKAASGLNYNLFADPFDPSKLALDLIVWFIPFGISVWAVTRLTRSRSR